MDVLMMICNDNDAWVKGTLSPYINT